MFQPFIKRQFVCNRCMDKEGAWSSRQTDGTWNEAEVPGSLQTYQWRRARNDRHIQAAQFRLNFEFNGPNKTIRFLLYSHLYIFSFRFERQFFPKGFKLGKKIYDLLTASHYFRSRTLLFISRQCEVDLLCIYAFWRCHR